ncbi:oxidoreductase [Streptomyces abyssalis]|uniref:Oxidoreductase n=1 Tax=Streptomyces abyssalis TaxID=933944 RepID=A0A1E7JVJ2_9ACTN|nr:PhzF family phenazine biosynthesis protein [Streptomyces abyssalis]OEU94434.1 oxidoreductase [Streptomyces abyssalis]OEU95813.1 oxidoreductase [Streptomyces abyssalis]OEV31404.1 oxidoreductase [Streptomyces nanshensis]
MRIRTVDAFTDRPYSGNPAAVVLLEEESFPPDERMQKVAGEMNLSETAFAHPLSADPEAGWALRWFTPTTEVDLCGHATLATAHVLHCDGRSEGTVRFRTRSGVLGAAAAPGGAITLNFPTAPLTPATAPDGLAPALGAEPVSVYDTGPLGDLLVEVADERTLRALAPDSAALARLPYRGVIVTALAEDGGGTLDGGHDYVSRMFAPASGIPEDPVTGSAHTALAPLWSGRLGRDSLTGLQCSARTGLVRTTLRGERTELTGEAVTVLDAQLCAGW